MSANVESMFYVREVPWHGLGTKLDNPPTSAEAIVAAGLDWNVFQKELTTEDGLQTNLLGNFRGDNNQFLGAVTDRYKIVQNKEAFDFMDELSAHEVQYETAGVLGVGQNVWLLAKMDNFKVLDDDISGYLCLNNSHDGKGSIRVAVTPVRVVCQNTLSLALRSTKRVWSTCHKGDFRSKKLQAVETLGLYRNYMTVLREIAEKLQQTPVSNDKAYKFTKEIFSTKDEDSDLRIRNLKAQQEELMYRFTEAPDIANFRNTGWGFINAVTDFAGHSDPLRITDTYEEKRFKNLVFDNNKIVDQALTLVKSA